MSRSNPFKKYFPLLTRATGLIYFDNAATTQKPEAVIKTTDNFYRNRYANVHRGIYQLSERATEEFEAVRRKVQKFIDAKYAEEIIFTSGATESINLVAHSFAEALLKRDDEILLTEAEHHSNIVPWQMAAKRKGLKIKYLPVFGDSNRLGCLDFSHINKLITPRTKLVAVTAASNVTGEIIDVRKIIVAAHKVGAKVLIDAAQAAGHMPIDVIKMDCDFLAFSGHKLFGPTGIGVLYGKRELLEKMPPYQTGGNMILQVNKKRTAFAPIPDRFEAGTPPIAEVIGLGAAIGFLRAVRWKNLQEKERDLTAYGLKKLTRVPGLEILGPTNPKNRLPIFSFTLAGIHAHDIATLLDRQGIAVRSGHHCAQILHQKFGLAASTRASLCFYNTREEIDRLVAALKRINTLFS